jgi:maleate isomerase
MSQRIGVIVPSTNTMVEKDFWSHAPANVSVHSARMYLEETTAEDELRMVTEYLPGAVRDLATCRPHVVVFACTSAGAVLGADGEEHLIRDLANQLGVPVVSTNEAVAATLAERGVRRPAVVTAYIPELTEKIVEVLKLRGIEPQQAYGMNIVDPFEIADVTVEEIIRFTQKHVNLEGIDGIFISCTNLRGLDAITALEAWSGLPVISSNQATLLQACKQLNPSGR